jgi:hypothetical protein
MAGLNGIPSMSFDKSKAEIRNDFRRHIDEDKAHTRCIWCKTGSSKKNKSNNHALLDCSFPRPTPDQRTSLSSEVFGAGVEDAVIAYVHHLQLHHYPRKDGATPFRTGIPRHRIPTHIAPAPPSVPVISQPVAALGAAPQPTSMPFNITAPALQSTQATTHSVQVPPVAIQPSQQSSASTTLPAVQPSAAMTNATSTQAVSATLASAFSTLSFAPAPPTTSQQIDIIYDDENVRMPKSQTPPGQSALAKTANVTNRKPDTDQKLSALRGVDLDYHTRQGFVKSTSRVYTNHFQIKIQPTQQLFMYKLESTMPGRNKRKTRALVKTAMQSYPFLSSNSAHFATDHFETIIAWTPLVPHGAGHVLQNGDEQSPGSQWRLPDMQDDGLSFQVYFSFEGMVDVAGLLQHIDMDPAAAAIDMEPTKRALNILVSKCFGEATTGMVQTGADKFFLKVGTSELRGTHRGALRASTSLCAMRGYYYTIKLGVRDILLNINSGVSAFYRPVLVSDLMRDRLTFSQHEVESALRGLRVHINYLRGDASDPAALARLNTVQARVKTIQGLGQPLEDEYWQDANTGQTHYGLAHLENSGYWNIILITYADVL